MRAEGASELKSTALPPSFSQRATLASSEFRPERLAGKTQSARAAPSARAERAARRQAVSLSVLWDHGWVGAKTLSHICLCCVSHTGGAIQRGRTGQRGRTDGPSEVARGAYGGKFAAVVVSNSRFAAEPQRAVGPIDTCIWCRRHRSNNPGGGRGV